MTRSVRALTQADWPEWRRMRCALWPTEFASERELASDALLENKIAHRAHEGVGFEEVERAVRYRKVLSLVHFR